MRCEKECHTVISKLTLILHVNALLQHVSMFVSIDDFDRMRVHWTKYEGWL